MTTAENRDDLPPLALVLGYIAIKELATLEDKVAILSRLGYDNNAIATICGSTPGSVAVRKTKAKKRIGR